jgi:hypothetical protein
VLCQVVYPGKAPQPDKTEAASFRAWQFSSRDAVNSLSCGAA